jgi:hypothetical protein
MGKKKSPCEKGQISFFGRLHVFQMDDDSISSSTPSESGNNETTANTSNQKGRDKPKDKMTPRHRKTKNGLDSPRCNGKNLRRFLFLFRGYGTTFWILIPASRCPSGGLYPPSG